MCNRAADESGVQHARQFQIGDELPLAGQQPAILAPQQRTPDLGAAALAHSTITGLVVLTPMTSPYLTRPEVYTSRGSKTGAAPVNEA